MKKEFEAPEVEVIRFSVEEIITDSDLYCCDNASGGDQEPPPVCLFD